MRKFRHIGFLLAIFMFVLNGTAAFASACDCPMGEATIQSSTPQSSAMSDMPCHKMADKEKTSDTKADEKDMTQCQDCKCSNCKPPAQHMILGQFTSTPVIIATPVLSAVNPIASRLIFGIDYPPRKFS